jgi:hypothetical protein
MDRRRFLCGLGTVTILVLGGAVWYADEEGAFSQGRGPAFAPWMDWNQPQTGMLALVRAGILAASPHNTQPWLFRVRGNEIEVLAETGRNTGGIGPFSTRTPYRHGVRSGEYGHRLTHSGLRCGY